MKVAAVGAFPQEELVVEGNSAEGKAYGREDYFRRKNASQTPLRGDWPGSGPLLVHGGGLLT